MALTLNEQQFIKRKIRLVYNFEVFRVIEIIGDFLPILKIIYL